MAEKLFSEALEREKHMTGEVHAYCPIGKDARSKCIKSLCQWWSTEYEMCAVRLLAFAEVG